MCGNEGESGKEMVHLHWNFTHASYFMTLNRSLGAMLSFCIKRKEWKAVMTFTNWQD